MGQKPKYHNAVLLTEMRLIFGRLTELKPLQSYFSSASRSNCVLRVEFDEMNEVILPVFSCVYMRILKSIKNGLSYTEQGTDL